MVNTTSPVYNEGTTTSLSSVASQIHTWESRISQVKMETSTTTTTSLSTPFITSTTTTTSLSTSFITSTTTTTSTSLSLVSNEKTTTPLIDFEHPENARLGLMYQKMAAYLVHIDTPFTGSPVDDFRLLLNFMDKFELFSMGEAGHLIVSVMMHRNKLKLQALSSFTDTRKEEALANKKKIQFDGMLLNKKIDEYNRRIICLKKIGAENYRTFTAWQKQKIDAENNYHVALARSQNEEDIEE